MTWWVLLVLALYFVQTLLPSVTIALNASAAERMDYALGPRDLVPGLSVLGGRLERAQHNMTEALFVFLPVALLIEIHGPASGLAVAGAAVFLAARVAYVIAYGWGVFGLRSVVWGVGHAGIAMMLLALLSSV